VRATGARNGRPLISSQCLFLSLASCPGVPAKSFLFVQ
jgi:hypothetical protein